MYNQKFAIMMTKSIKNILCGILLASMWSCDTLKDDDHYAVSESEIANEELRIVSSSSREYIAQRADLSEMNALFEQQGIYEELAEKGQLSTLLVVVNDHFNQPVEDVEYLTRSHVSDVSISPANLADGTRLMMWHGKYVNVSIDSLGQEGHIVNHIYFNNGAVEEVIKTTTGYVYVISEMIETPTSLYDYINELGPEYSIFHELVMASGGKEFDRANSKAIGVNDQGNTIYDSVFIYRNTFFENVGFDMTSESLTATMLLFSNDVINEALADAHQRLALWDMERSDSIMRNWVLKAAFYNQQYRPEELQTVEANDLTSVFSAQWRTNVQQIDTENSVSLSNAIVYKVKKLHLPNNLLMYRLKDEFHLYEYCTAEQKEQYFQAFNLTYKSCDTEVTAWTPWAGVWPLHENRVLRFDKTSGVDDAGGFQLDFTPIKQDADGTVRPYLIPPGSYRLAMGSVQNQGLDVVVRVMIGGEVVAQSPTITWGTSTAYHYDRGTTLPNRYPEGYDSEYVREHGGDSKAANYDTDGGPMIDEVTIPDVNGDGTPQQIVLRINCENWATKTNVKLNHWCLRPTVNNY